MPHVESIVSATRKRYHDATHHCTAFRLGPTGATFRHNDDGEPAGTAGQPILRQVDAFGFTNVVVIVTRYYGGTKLGTGGLSRAYGDAAHAVLGLCAAVTYVIRRTVHVEFAYADLSKVMRLIETSGGRVEASEYADNVKLVVGVPRSSVPSFARGFTDRLAGRGTATVVADG